MFDDPRWETIRATYRGSAAEVVRIRAAFRGLLDLKLSDFTTAQIDRWRAVRRNCHPSIELSSKRNAREVSRSTVNRDVSALRAALSKPWNGARSRPCLLARS